MKMLIGRPHVDKNAGVPEGPHGKTLQNVWLKSSQLAGLPTCYFTFHATPFLEVRFKIEGPRRIHNFKNITAAQYYGSTCRE